ncbi:ATPase [Streptomyces lucensis JCM 4490]|uniref:ATPase n=1 Tax=Streptomyces lucensis JCM 4490 TaxID=1306176 RepID=A0A918JA73_9ACTN|nr:ATPase [Streptomyces lucensis JCM 4490]
MMPSPPLGTDAAADRSGLGADGSSPARACSGAGAGATPAAGAARRGFRFELAAHPGSVAQARRLAHARLTGWSVGADTCDNAALVVSELVTNAIVHTASSRVVCELHDHDDTVRIAVRDEGCAPGEPHTAAQRPDEEHGRGLFLVDALCRAWGAQEHGPGLLVWAELARRTDAAPETAEPRNDLGWGARPKPGRPDDSGQDDPAEARRRPPEQHRPPGADHPPHAPEQRGHAHHGGPEQHRRPAPEQHRRAAPGPQPLHRTPEQHGHAGRGDHVSPEQHRTGERP